MRAVQFQQVEAGPGAAGGRGDELAPDLGQVGAVSSRGTWPAGEYGTGDGPQTSQLPSGSGSSMPSHISLVEPLRPEWPSWRPIAAPDEACTKSTTRRQPASCSSV